MSRRGLLRAPVAWVGALLIGVVAVGPAQAAEQTRPGAKSTATQPADTAGPAFDQLHLEFDQPKYVYNADASVTQRYRLHITDAESGFDRGKLVVRGSHGGVVSARFAVVRNAAGELWCGTDFVFDTQDLECPVEVTIPKDAPAGTWSVSQVKLVDAAGNVSTTSGLSAAAMQVTQNRALSAADFAISPEQYNNWTGFATLTVTMRPLGAQNGISSVTLLLDKCSGSVTENPTIAADGTISVLATVAPIVTKQCKVTGIGVIDGAGNAAAYGTAFRGPELDLVATQIPNTQAPVVNSASLAVVSVPASSLPRNDGLTLDVTSFAGITGFSLTVYDADGISVDGASGGVGSVTSGELKLTVPLHQGLAPGTYTVGFTLTDASGLFSQYGYPNGGGLPVPGGPLQITVTDE
ncbi:hypothetical protein ABZ904_32465 [Streptomyces sp. NPDC046900]|uniref:hypothetical protein n=1 Tax=Streptomyces sp. NPDC046900 TaxID=3155473 RepID=UPI0034002CD8